MQKRLNKFPRRANEQSLTYPNLKVTAWSCWTMDKCIYICSVAWCSSSYFESRFVFATCKLQKEGSPIIFYKFDFFLGLFFPQLSGVIIWYCSSWTGKEAFGTVLGKDINYSKILELIKHLTTALVIVGWFSAKGHLLNT